MRPWPPSACASCSTRQSLESQFTRARLQALRMQLDPHFLYNSLGAVAGLVRCDPAAAEQMVTRLGELFRRVLAERNSEFVTLRREIAHGVNYLEIQRLRFPARLAYTLRVQPGLDAVAIPPLLLQPLLENAVEHGLHAAQGTVSIEIDCRPLAERIAITIVNQGAVPAAGLASPDDGLGQVNVRERLHAAFGAASEFSFSSPAPGRYEARLVFPRRALDEKDHDADRR